MMVMMIMMMLLEICIAIVVFEAFFFPIYACEVGRARIIICILTDVKSGSTKLRDVPGVTQLERDGAWIKTQAIPLPGEGLA